MAVCRPLGLGMQWKRWIVVVGLICGGCSKLNASFSGDTESGGNPTTVDTTEGPQRPGSTSTTDATDTTRVTDSDPTLPKPTSGTTQSDTMDPDSTGPDLTGITTTTGLEGSEVGETGAPNCEPPMEEGCDLLSGGCGRGFRCLPYDSSGNNLPNAFGCFPDARVLSREDCFGYCGPFGGTNTCPLGQLCEPLENNTSECVQMCRTNVGCGVGECGVGLLPGNTFGVCRVDCDPFDPDCPDDQGCLINDDQDGFTCAPVGVLTAGTPCSFLDDCGVGLMCTAESSAPGCEETPCCSQICSISGGGCPGEAECFPLFPGSLHDTDVGVCL